MRVFVLASIEQAARLKKMQEDDKKKKVEFRKKVNAHTDTCRPNTLFS